jgi:pimeloyl-ACP methyl ester carboxylesterase
MVLRPRGGKRPGLKDKHLYPHAPHTDRATLFTPSSNPAPTPVHGYARSFDGTRLFYSVEGKGTPLVFCYGLVCSSLHWTYQVEHFRNHHQAIWFDYRGHHRSDPPSDFSTYSVENFARDTLAILDELKIEKAVILGHSMGVNVVLDFYRQFPNRVAGMVLANGTSKGPMEFMFNSNAFQTAFKALDVAYRAAPRMVEKLWRMTEKNPFSKTMVTLGGFNPYLASPEDVELYIHQVANTDPKVFLKLIQDYEKFDATGWLHQIDVPTLIIGGQNDHLIPRSQQELMHQLIPGSKLEIIHHGSHCPQMDLPELVNMKIEKFLSLVSFGRSNLPVSPREAPINPLPGTL